MDIPDLSDITISVESSKIRGALKQLVENQKQLGEQSAKFEEKVKVVESRLGDSVVSGKNLHEAYEARASELKQVAEKLKEIEGLDLYEAIAKIKAEEEAREKILERLGNNEILAKEQDKRLAENLEDLRRQATQTIKLSEEVNKIGKDWKEKSRNLDEALSNFSALNERCESLKSEQEALNSSVSSKYEKLWQQVLDALKDVNAKEIQDIQSALENTCSETEKRVQSLVSYSLGFMAEAAVDRKRRKSKKAVISAWREHSWIASRRRLGILLIHKYCKCTLRKHWDRMTVVLNWSLQLSQLERMYQSKSPDIETQIKEIVGNTFSPLESKLDKLCEDSGSKSYVDNQLQACLKKFDDKFVTLEQKTTQLSLQTDDLRVDHEKITDKVENISTKSVLVERVKAAEGSAEEAIKRLSATAKDEDVKSIMKDMLQLWHSLKQMDMDKAEKRDLDKLALETANRDKVTGRKLDELQEYTTAELSDKLNQIETRLSQCEFNLSASNTKTRTLNNMIGTLIQFVEDIVVRLATKDGINKPVPPRMIIRTGGGFREMFFPPESATAGAMSEPEDLNSCKSDGRQTLRSAANELATDVLVDSTRFARYTAANEGAPQQSPNGKGEHYGSQMHEGPFNITFLKDDNYRRSDSEILNRRSKGDNEEPFKDPAHSALVDWVNQSRNALNIAPIGLRYNDTPVAYADEAAPHVQGKTQFGRDYDGNIHARCGLFGSPERPATSSGFPQRSRNNPSSPNYENHRAKIPSAIIVPGKEVPQIGPFVSTKGSIHPSQKSASSIRDSRRLSKSKHVTSSSGGWMVSRRKFKIQNPHERENY